MNTTTLNMTTLDGGVIIKKGTAPAPPSGGESGGGNLSPDAIVYEPNGWYWKLVEGVPSDFNGTATVLLGITHDLGAKYYSGIIKYTSMPNYSNKSMSILMLGANIARMQNSADNTGVYVIAVEESRYCSVKIDDTMALTGNSMYEIINQVQPMTEAEFDNFMQANIGLMRITKEEYEALTTE